jgi:hypothetical protein
MPVETCVPVAGHSNTSVPIFFTPERSDDSSLSNSMLSERRDYKNIDLGRVKMGAVRCSVVPRIFVTASDFSRFSTSSCGFG